MRWGKPFEKASKPLEKQTFDRRFTGYDASQTRSSQIVRG